MRIFFATPHFRVFNGATPEHEPMGGTESALIGLSRALARKGLEVSVYCNCQGIAGYFEGVKYVPIEQLEQDCLRLQPHFLIVLSGVKYLRLTVPNGYKIWWAHSDCSHIWEELPDIKAEMIATLATASDGIAVLSEWQAERLAHTLHLERKHFWISPYGIEPDDFQSAPTPSDPPRLLYTSAPNRGLALLLRLFPRIRAQVPNVELHIYSGLQVWSGIHDPWEEYKSQRVLRHATGQIGIFWYPPQAKPQLYQALRSGTLWTYPNHAAPDSTTWAETFCLAALEAQAAGLPVITSARGALPETVADQISGILIPGDPDSESYQQTFVDTTLHLLNHPAQRQQLAQQARTRALREFNWEKIARHWLHMFTHFKSSRMATTPYQSPFRQPLITVLVWCISATLRDTLTALTQQDGPSFDVIVFNPLSEIISPEDIQQFRQQLNLRYRTPETLEMELHEMVRGQVALFIESDMILPPGCLQAHWQAHQTAQPAAIYSSYTYRAEALSPEADSLTLNPDLREELGLFTKEYSAAQAFMAEPGGFSLSYLSLKQLGGYRLELYPECEALQKFTQAMAHHALPVALLDDEGTLWRQFTPERAQREQLRWETCQTGLNAPTS